MIGKRTAPPLILANAKETRFYIKCTVDLDRTQTGWILRGEKIGRGGFEEHRPTTLSDLGHLCSLMDYQDAR